MHCRKIKTSALILMAALLFTSQGGGNSAAVVTVELFDLVYITGGRVILGQIAELTGEMRSVERLKTLQIGTVMKRRESRIITPEEIRRALPNDIEVSFTGAPAVEVIPAASTDQFCQIAPSIERRFTVLGGDSIVVSSTLTDSVAEPAGELLAPVQYKIISTAVLTEGRQIVSLERCDSSGQIRRLHLPVEIQLFARLTFALKHIPRGQTIKAEDVAVRTVDLKTTGITGLLFQPSRVIGWEAVRHISPDSPLRWDHVRPPVVVRKGEGVSLLLGVKNFQVRASATALEAGYPGQKIWVRLEDNGKRMRATVLEGGCVMIE